MKAVFKYPITESCTITMPAGAKILSVHGQSGIPNIWALVDNKETFLVKRYFEYFQTGAEIPRVENKEYIGTFFLFGEQYVYHLFEDLSKLKHGIPYESQ